MAGTRTGGLKAAAANKAKNKDFYKEIGAIGGKISREGGFASGEIGRERARIAGRKGGLKSRRGDR
jgi:general stress protein YciG